MYIKLVRSFLIYFFPTLNYGQNKIIENEQLKLIPYQDEQINNILKLFTYYCSI